MAKFPKLNFHQPAPDHTMTNNIGELVALSSLWKEKPVLLAFTRHLGCSQCKEMVSQLSAAREQIEASGLHIAIVTQGTVNDNIFFEQEYGKGLLFLSDSNLAGYKKFFLPKGNIFQLFLNPKIWLPLKRSIAKGFKAELPPKGQDAAQMSGMFIIGRDGRVELPYYYDHIADHPPTDLFLSGVLSSKWANKFEGAIGRKENENTNN